MADQNIDIRINTQANIAGVTQATASVNDMEKKLEDLQQELRKVPVGGDEFAQLSGKIKAVKDNLNNAEVAANKLGATTGRNGNAGMAMLQFSQLADDAQYGLRGILNNLTPLIMSLGGTAGLAGVLSVAAIAASQLWERLGDGSKGAEDDLDGVIERAKDLKERFIEAGKAAAERLKIEAGKEDERLANAMKDIDRRSNQNLGKIEAQEARIEAEKRIALSNEGYKLAMLEMGVRLSGEKSSLSVAEQRLEIERQIERIIRSAAEQMRQAQEARGKEKVDQAQVKAGEVREIVTDRGNDLQNLQEKLAEAIRQNTERGERVAAAQKELEDATKAYSDLIEKMRTVRQGLRPGELDEAKARKEAAQKSLKDAKELPDITEGQIKGLREQVRVATDLYKEAAKDLVDFRKAAKDAAIELEKIKSGNDRQREAEAVETKNQNTVKDTKAKQEGTIVSLNDLLSQVTKSGKASPEMASAVKAIEEATKDGNLSREDLGMIELVMARFRDQMLNLGVLPKTIEDTNTAVGDLTRRLTALETKAPTPGGPAVFTPGNTLPTPAGITPGGNLAVPGLTPGGSSTTPPGMTRGNNVPPPGGVKDDGSTAALEDMKGAVQQGIQNAELIREVAGNMRQFGQELSLFGTMNEAIRELSRTTSDHRREIERIKMQMNS